MRKRLINSMANLYFKVPILRKDHKGYVTHSLAAVLKMLKRACFVRKAAIIPAHSVKYTFNRTLF